jgi:probable phosphoglycerate mutase
MRLILVRHGRPNEIDSATPGDPSLNPDGWRQARAVARLLAGEGVTRIVASPMRRAQETAQPLAERLGLAIDTVAGWAEADRGAHRYRSTETLRAEGGQAWERFLADPIRYLGGEPAAFRADVLAALEATTAGEDRTARVVAFTHGLPVNVALAHALGLDGVTTFLVGYGSVTRLRRRPDGNFGVSSVNETAHLRSGD